MYFHKYPAFLKILFPQFLWRVNTGKKEIYLTFDDGPIPEITEWILAELAKFQAKATFFCVGDNIRKYPQIFKKVVSAGHSVGNHTFNHLDGWKTEPTTYLKNMADCDAIMMQNLPSNYFDDRTKLFRAPHVRIKRKQWQEISKTHKIVMMDVVSGDFDKNLKPEICLQKTIAATQKGSIVIFHDNIKAATNLKYALPLFLEHFAAIGFIFKALP